MNKTKKKYIDSLLDKETLSEEDFIKLNRIWEQFLQWKKNKDKEKEKRNLLNFLKPMNEEYKEEDFEYEWDDDNY